MMKLREMPRDLAFVTLAMIIANIAGNMSRPFEPLYLESLGATVQQIGIYFTIQTVMAVAFRVLGGWISDTVGRLSSIAAGGVLGLGAFLGYVLAPTWQWAMVGALLGLAGSSLVAPSFQAFTAESAPEGATGSTFGLVEGLFLTCQIIGPVLGGFLVQRYGFKLMLWTATGIFFVAAVVRLWMARHSKLDLSRLRFSNLKRDLRGLILMLLGGGAVTWLFLIDGLRDTSFQVFWPFMPKYVTEIGGQSETMYGGLIAMFSFMMAVANWPGGILADRFGERWGIAGGGVLLVATLVIILLFPTTIGFWIAFSLLGLAGAVMSPAFSSLLSKTVPRESLGITYGIFWSALGVMAIPAPYLGGLLYENFSPQLPIMVSAVIVTITIPVALWKLSYDLPESKSRAAGLSQPPVEAE